MQRMVVLLGGALVAVACGSGQHNKGANAPEAAAPPTVSGPEPVEVADNTWWADASPCPDGTQLEGAAPPAGDEVWCARTDGTKNGPWTWFHEDGSKLSEGRYAEGDPEGMWTTWHENGTVKMQGMYVDGKQDGRWRAWHENGAPATDIGMKAGVRQGEWLWWYENGKVAGQGSFVDGLPHGRRERWDQNGELRKVEIYDHDRLVRAILYRDGEPIASRAP